MAAGWRDRAVRHLGWQLLPPEIKPLSDAMVAAGRAMPVLEADCFGETIVLQDKKSPFGLMFDALDDLRSGEVYVCQGGSPRYALWGELMSTRVSRVVAPNV